MPFEDSGSQPGRRGFSALRRVQILEPVARRTDCMKTNGELVEHPLRNPDTTFRCLEHHSERLHPIHTLSTFQRWRHAWELHKQASLGVFRNPSASSHRPQPSPAKMSPDDDDNDSHFGFCTATNWKRIITNSEGREHKYARFAKSAGIGRSSVCSTQERAEKPFWFEPSTIVTWRAAILRTCTPLAPSQRTGSYPNSVEPKPGGERRVIGDAWGTARLICV